MRGKLVGRLTWEPAGEGISVVIPARLDWWIAPLAVFLSAITEIDWFYLPITLSDGRLSPLVWIYVMTPAALACIFVCWFLWGMTGKTILVVDPSELKLVRRVIGIEWDTRRFATYDVVNLRYISPEDIWAFRTDTDPTTSKIQFQTKDKTIRYARGITEKEACALFDKMMGVYKFPSSSELDQKGFAQ